MYQDDVSLRTRDIFGSAGAPSIKDDQTLATFESYPVKPSAIMEEEGEEEDIQEDMEEEVRQEEEEE
jgi:hypothetical protein